jgi:signal recognition particle receptor subunit beta
MQFKIILWQKHLESSSTKKPQIYLASKYCHSAAIRFSQCFFFQRLAGATLLVFSNKQDLPGALLVEEIRDVSLLPNETNIIL